MLGTIEPARHDPVGGLLIVVAAAFCISLSNVLAPLVYAAGSNAYTLLILRYCGFLAVCGLWLCVQKAKISLNLTDVLTCCGAGLAYAFGAGALLASFSFVSVGLAILIFFTFPVLTRILECALDRQMPSFMEIGCLTGAFAGLAILLGMRAGQLDWLGPFLAIMASLGVAGSYVWTGRRLKHVQPMVMTFIMSVAGLLFALALATMADGWRISLAGSIEWFVLVAAILSFSMAFLAMFAGVRLIGASRTAMTMNLEPVFTICLAFLILGERLTSTQLFGAVVVLVSIILAQLIGPKHQSRPSASDAE